MIYSFVLRYYKYIFAGIALIVSFMAGYKYAKNVYNGKLLEYENAIVKQSAKEISESAELSRKQSEAALYALQTVEANFSKLSKSTTTRKVIETRYEQSPDISSDTLPRYWVQLYNNAVSKGATEIDNPRSVDGKAPAIKAITAVELINDNTDQCNKYIDQLTVLQDLIRKSNGE